MTAHCYTPAWCKCPDEPMCQLCKQGRCPVDSAHPFEGSTSQVSAAWNVSMWEGAAVVRLIPLRMALNFWRLREHTQDGFRVRFYRTRRGVTILSVKAVVV